MTTVHADCGSCRHFVGEPAALEAALPGLNILSSAYGSVRGDTGLCRLSEAFVVVSAGCSAWSKTDVRVIPGQR